MERGEVGPFHDRFCEKPTSATRVEQDRFQATLLSLGIGWGLRPHQFLRKARWPGIGPVPHLLQNMVFCAFCALHIGQRFLKEKSRLPAHRHNAFCCFQPVRIRLLARLEASELGYLTGAHQFHRGKWFLHPPIQIYQSGLPLPR